MELQNCIKFSYCGLTRFIICQLDSHYEDIIKLAQTSFDIPKEYIKAIYITNGSGYVFEKHLFEYFLLLFPQPVLKFYIRLDYSKVAMKQPTQPEATKAAPELRLPFGYSKLNNKRARTEGPTTLADEDVSYAASPVRRQNCFLGAMPSNSSEAEHLTAGSKLQTAKRLRLMLNTQKPLLARKTQASTTSKRSLRI